jgi:DNA-binding transcriptional regulator GbsR (MarR family)
MGNGEFDRFRSELMERMARIFEESGTSPLVGRIYALLICSPEPISLQEIAERLGVTKAAVSIQVRTLETHGHCLKLARGNDRKHYYCIPDEHLQISMRMVMERMNSELKWIEDTLRKLPDPQGLLENEKASFQVLQQRYTELAVFYRVVFRRLDGVEEEMERLIADMRRRDSPNGQ